MQTLTSVQVVACANGSGETLRSVIARLALDEAMFGNAFMEVVTDSEGQVVMDFDAIERIPIADENADSVADDDEDIIDF